MNETKQEIATMCRNLGYFSESWIKKNILWPIGNPSIEENGTMIYWPNEALLDLMGPKECGWKIHATKNLDKSKSEVFDLMEPNEYIHDYLYGYMDWDSVIDARADFNLYCVAVIPNKNILNKTFKEIQIEGYFS